MAVYVETAEGGSDGVAVSSANSAFSSVVLAGSGAITFSVTQAAHGTKSIKIVPDSANPVYVIRTVTSGTTHSIAFNLWLPEAPTVSSEFLRVRTGAAQIAKLIITTGRLINVQNAAGTVVFTGATAIPTGQWVRVEMSWIIGTTTSNGTLNFQWFSAVDGTTAIDTFTSSAQNLGTTNGSQVWVGRTAQNAWVTPYYVDDVRIVEASSTLLGPYLRSSPSATGTGTGTGTATSTPRMNVSASGTGSGAGTATSTPQVHSSAAGTGSGAGSASYGVSTLVAVRAFDTSTPNDLVQNDTSSVNLGLEFVPEVTTEVVALWVYIPGDGSVTTQDYATAREGGIFAVNGDGTGTLMSGSQVTFSGVTTSGWHRAELASPVTVIAGGHYRAAIRHPSGRYAANSHYFDSGIYVSGANLDVGPGVFLVLSWGNADAQQQGSFNYNSFLDYPNGAFNSANYWTDVEFTTGSSSPGIATAPSSSGSGTGTGTASLTALSLSRSASGTGTGTGTATARAAVSRTAPGTGRGTGTATARPAVHCTATGTGTGTGTASAVTAPTGTLNASGTGQGTGTATERIAVSSLSAAGTGRGVGAGTFRPLLSATGSSSGTGTAQSTIRVVRAASGTSSGAGTATFLMTVQVSGTGLGRGTGQSVLTAVGIMLTTSGTGSGAGTASAVQTVTHVLSTSGTGLGTGAAATYNPKAPQLTPEVGGIGSGRIQLVDGPRSTGISVSLGGE